MANMSYCRFENTTQDFRDCIDALREEEEAVVGWSGRRRMSAHERQFADQMVELCRNYIEAHEALVAAEDEAQDEEEDDTVPPALAALVQSART